MNPALTRNRGRGLVLRKPERLPDMVPPNPSRPAGRKTPRSFPDPLDATPATEVPSIVRSLSASLIVFIALMCSSAVAGAAPPPDRASTAELAATWLLAQVEPGGYLVSPYTGNPDLGSTAQAVIALTGAGRGESQVAAMVAYLEAHVDDYVDPSGSASTDSPGALAWLILDAAATGGDPYDFGGSNLVTRLQATQRVGGLFGLTDQDPTYDGTVRQGLSLLALHAVGVDNVSGLTWLEDQQCVDGSFMAYRTDIGVACPAVDAAHYTGPDTNSTAFAAMALHAGGATADANAAAGWLTGVRATNGGFPYYGDPTQPSDGNSTGLVSLALTTVTGTVDTQAVSALAALQTPCDGDPADIGGIAYQPAGGTIAPDQMATIQALLGLNGLAFPLVTPDLWHEASATCPVAEPTTTTTTSTTSTTTTTVAEPAVTVAPDTSVAARIVTGSDELPQTGGGVGGLGDGELGALGALLLAAGAITVVAERRRRHVDA